MRLFVAILSLNSRRLSEPVLEFRHNALDFSFGAPASISVPPFEQIDEVVALTVDSIEIVGTEFGPVVVEFIPKLLPLCSNNVGFHVIPLFPSGGLLRPYFWLMRFLGMTFSSPSINGRTVEFIATLPFRIWLASNDSP